MKPLNSRLLKGSLFLLLLLGVPACAEGEDTPAPGSDMTEPTGAEDTIAGEEGETQTVEPEEETDPEEVPNERYAASEIPEPAALGDSYLVVDHLTFPFATEEGTCIGFDLDEKVTTDADEDPCGWADYESPDGEVGVDNNLAQLTPLFDAVGLGQAFQYLQDSIESSGFFLMWELRGLDDLENDDDIELIFHLGGGAGLLGTDGDLISSQTLCIQNNTPASPSTSARLEDGWLYAEFDSLTLPLVLFERLYEFVFLGARLKARLSPDGTLSDGVVGGVLTLDNILQIAEKGGQNQGGLYETVQLVLSGMGDMPTEDGECDGLSSAFEFTSLPVFVYPEDMDCDTCGDGKCESFESCETCLLDCCPDCGDGICNVYPQEVYGISVSDEGFSPSSQVSLVGDKIQFLNDSESVIHVLCENFFDPVEIQAGEVFETVTTQSGEFSCRTLEFQGLLGSLQVNDNYSETCQSCPGDCPDGC